MTGHGFALSYPRTWSFRWDGSLFTTTTILGELKSDRIPVCSSTQCVVPPGALLVTFSTSFMYDRREFKHANASIGGQAAVRTDLYLPSVAVNGSARTDWTPPPTQRVRSMRYAVERDGPVFFIYAAVTGPDDPALEQELDDVLASLTFDSHG